MARNYHQGIFKPHNPAKYKGNVKNIVYRSWWEFVFMRKLDADDNIVEWSSEELAIPYRSPKDNRIHRYFPDFHYKTRDGKTYIVEIKPFDQTKPPKNNKRKNYINEAMTYCVNRTKWEAAAQYCAKYNAQFKVLTEKDLNFGNKNK